jgi:hypothetical protein
MMRMCARTMTMGRVPRGRLGRGEFCCCQAFFFSFSSHFFLWFLFVFGRFGMGDGLTFSNLFLGVGLPDRWLTSEASRRL